MTDEELIETMNLWLDRLRIINQTDPPHLRLRDDQIKMKIMAQSLRGLADVLLMVDDGTLEVDLKKTALGLLGSADWLEE